MFQSALSNSAHVYRTGLTFLHDVYDERQSNGRTYLAETPAEAEARQHRTCRKLMPGTFAEYTYQNSLNLKNKVAKNMVLRLAAGRGYRMAKSVEPPPFGPTFVAAMTWGPVHGRLTYAGLHSRIE